MNSCKPSSTLIAILELNLNQFITRTGQESEDERHLRRPEQSAESSSSDSEPDTLSAIVEDRSDDDGLREGGEPGVDGESQKKVQKRRLAEKPSNSDFRDGDRRPNTYGQSADESRDDPDSDIKHLIRAIQSLDRSIQSQGQIVNRKVRRERSASMAVESNQPVVRKALCAQTGLPLPTTALRTDKVTVYVRVVFLKIGEIDTLKENFMADAFIQTRWQEPLLDGKAGLNPDEINWEHYWNPKVYVENNLGEPKENVWQTFLLNANGQAMVYERRRLKGCFLENLELDEFPFDTQDLTLTITSERSEAELELTEDTSEISSINVQSFVDEQEWKLHNHVETWKRVTTRMYRNSKYKHPAFSASCRASRRPGFFVWNIFLVMLFICSLAFATYTVKLNLPQNRLQLSFILLLTTITFKFVVSQTLPRISYLTFLDKYILTSMGILCAVCVWHSIVPLIDNHYGYDVANITDLTALALLGGLYLMFHVCFFLYIYFAVLKKRWKYSEKDLEHKERIKRAQLSSTEETSTYSILKLESV